MIGTTTQKTQVALYTVALLLATLAVVGRLWARRITRARLQINDWLMILAYVNVIGLAIAASLSVSIGQLGVHLANVPDHLKAEAKLLNMKMTIILPLFLITSSYLTKLSITHFYIMLFPNTAIYHVCRLQFVIITLSCIASVVRCLTLCRPLAYVWDRTLNGKCEDFKDFSLEMSVLALVFDVTCTLLPIPVVWRLRLKKGEKIRLTVLFGLGVLICILTSMRIYYTEQFDFADLMGTAAPAVMFGVPEPALSIVAGCIPIILPLYRMLSKELTSSISERIRRYRASKKSSSLPTQGEEKPSLQCHPSYLYPYPCSAVLVGRGSDCDFLPSFKLQSPILAQCAGGVDLDNTVRSGITVLTEVRIDSARASWAT